MIYCVSGIPHQPRRINKIVSEEDTIPIWFFNDERREAFEGETGEGCDLPVNLLFLSCLTFLSEMGTQKGGKYIFFSYLTQTNVTLSIYHKT